MRHGWSLRDDKGIRHLPLRDNDEEAWWTPIACGEGICLPGTQWQESVTCPECLAVQQENR